MIIIHNKYSYKNKINQSKINRIKITLICTVSWSFSTFLLIWDCCGFRDCAILHWSIFSTSKRFLMIHCILGWFWSSFRCRWGIDTRSLKIHCDPICVWFGTGWYLFGYGWWGKIDWDQGLIDLLFWGYFKGCS